MIRAAVLVSLAASACQAALPDSATEDVPAVVAESNAASLIELREVVAKALPHRPVLLADDVFTKSSLLVVERRRQPRIEGSLDAGVADENPERFRLVLRDGECELVHVNTDTRYRLTETRCRAETQASD